jgi:hypothetical protein
MSRIFLEHYICLVLAYVPNILNILGRLCPTRRTCSPPAFQLLSMPELDPAGHTRPLGDPQQWSDYWGTPIHGHTAARTCASVPSPLTIRSSSRPPVAPTSSRMAPIGSPTPPAPFLAAGAQQRADESPAPPGSTLHHPVAYSLNFNLGVQAFEPQVIVCLSLTCTRYRT